MQNGPLLDRDELVRLFRVLSHDLKSPIFSIDGFSELLLADYGDLLDEEGHDFVGRIRNGVSQMKTTLDGFSTTVNLLAEPNQIQEVDLDELIEQVHLKLAYQAEESNVVLQIETGMPRVKGDPNKLKELFSALLSNAIMYGDPESAESRVAVRHTSTDGMVEITVEDNGIGIDGNYHEQIFEAGLRLDKRRGNGSGCGLYVARKIIESHGGRIRVDAEERKGSKFVLTLPRG